MITDNTAGQDNRPLTNKSNQSRPSNEGKIFLSLKEIADKYKISLRSLYRLIKTDPSFPYVNMGFKKKYMICPDEFEVWSSKRIMIEKSNQFTLPSATELIERSKL